MRNITLRLGMIIVALLSCLDMSAYDFEVDGVFYNVKSAKDFTCTVVQSPNKYSGEIEIPKSVIYNSRELNVVEVGNDAFEACPDLTRVKLPNGITYIGQSSFKGCTKLTNINIPNTVTMIGYNAFQDCFALKSITIPNSVRYINGGAFMGCTNLTDIILSDNLYDISSEVFSGCSSLEEISIPNSVTSIGSSSFYNCISLKDISLPETVKAIWKNAFYGCIGLTSVQLPYVESIGENAFSNCSNLEEFGCCADVNHKIHSSWDAQDEVKSIFNKCPKLKKIIVYSALGKYDSEYNEMIKCYHKWITEINIVELDLRAKYFSNYYERKVTSRNNYYYELILNSVESVILHDGKPLSAYSYMNSSSCYHWRFLLEESDNLRAIRFEGEPPRYGYVNPYFTDDQYMNTTLYVPESLLEKYKETTPWSYFWNIKTLNEYSGIEIVVSAPNNNSIIGRFDLNGNSVSNLYKGIVIIRYSDGSTKKVVQ